MNLSVKTNKISAIHPKLGPLLYVSSVQYFLLQLLVGLRFSPRYSLANNTISDLANTNCGVFNNRQVCSPLHSLMNISFIVLGIVMIAGSMFLYNQFKKSRSVLIGFSLFAIGGIGVILVGLFPENTFPVFHSIGAALPFLVGNIGVIVLGFTLKISQPMSIYTVSTGLIALIALGLYASSHYLGLGAGGIERVVAYPQTIWMIVVGIYFLSQPNFPTSKCIASSRRK